MRTPLQVYLDEDDLARLDALPPDLGRQFHRYLDEAVVARRQPRGRA